MSGTGARRLLNAVPNAVWNAAMGPDLDRELESSRRVAAKAINENAEAERVLDEYDPDPEPGEPLHERLRRVLGPRLASVKENGR